MTTSLRSVSVAKILAEDAFSNADAAVSGITFETNIGFVTFDRDLNVVKVMTKAQHDSECA